MPSKSDIDHWYINATVHKDRVEEIHYVTDAAKNIRRRPQTRVWEVERFLGRGGFGEVRLERSKEDGKARAVKKIATNSTTLSYSECEKELKALLEFSKPKSREAAVFVEFFGWFKDGPDIFLAMEYVPLGDLERNVVANSGKIPEIEVRSIVEQIISGLEIMHEESFAHRDLKPQNVLVIHGPPEWWVKLADFGLSKRLTETTAYHTRSGTQSYMAPEMLNYLDADVPGTEYTNAVDLWAIGCITYRLITGVVPFPPGRSLMEYCGNKSLFPFDPLFDSGIRSSGSEFIRELLATHPKERLSASQALRHIWIISSPDTKRRSEGRLQTNQVTPGFSELAISAIDYNTVSHGGLVRSRLMQDSASSLPGDKVVAARHTLKGHSDWVYAVSFSPDGKLLASASGDSTVIFWDPVSGRGLRKLKGHLDRVDDVVFSPDGKQVASGSKDKTVRLWDVASGRARYTLKGHSDSVTAIAFSPDSKLVASASSDNTVRLWDAATGAVYCTLKHSESVYSVVFSPDSKLVASSGLPASPASSASTGINKTITLWDARTGAACRTLNGHSHLIRAIAFSPDGKLLASGSIDETVRLWDVASGRTRGILKGHSGWVDDVVFSPDSKLLASASNDHTAMLWDATTGAAYYTLRGHSERVNSVIFSPDGKVVASASWDTTIRLWNTATGAACRRLEGHSKSVTAAVFSPDGKQVASASGDEKVRLWDATITAAENIA